MRHLFHDAHVFLELAGRLKMYVYVPLLNDFETAALGMQSSHFHVADALMQNLWHVHALSSKKTWRPMIRCGAYGQQCAPTSILFFSLQH